MKHRVFWIACVLVLLPAMLFAAGGSEQPSATAEGPATIKWMMRWDNARVEAVAMPVIEAFQEANPDITIEFENIGKGSDYYTKLNTLVAAGDMPDVTYLAPHYVAIFAAKNAIVPVNKHMEAAGIDTSQYYQKVLNFYKDGDNVYGLPIDAAALVTFYNTDMFDEYGVAYPEEGWTWDDLIEISANFVKDFDNDGTIDQYGIHLRPDYWPVYLKANTDHTVFDDYFTPTKYLMTEPESIQALQEYYDMWLVHGIAPGPSEVQQIKDYFMAGKAAMIIVGAWNMPKYISNITDFKWNLAPLPLGDSGKPYNRGDGSAFALSAHSDSPKAAFRFINFLAGPGSRGVEILLDRQQMLPALIDMAESERFLNPAPELTGGLDLNKAAFFFGNDNQFSMYDPIDLVYEKINSVHKAELNQASLGVVSVEEAVGRAAEQIAEILEEVE